MSDYFGRRLNLIIGNNTDQISIEHLNVEFEIYKSDGEELNESSISVFNLSPESISLLESKGTKIALEAGYERADFGLIFSGDIDRLETEKSGADESTKIFLGDGRNALKESWIDISWEGEVSNGQVIRSCAEALGLTLKFVGTVPRKVFNRGFFAFGHPLNALKKVLRVSNYSYSIQNNELKIWNKEDGDQTEIVKISPSSGLIGTPKKLIKDDKFVGYEITSLLLPFAQPGGRIQIESSQVNGVFKISKVKHTGSIEGDAWFTVLEGGVVK